MSFTYKLGFSSSDLSEQKTVYVTKTELPSPTSVTYPNFSRTLRLGGSDPDTSDEMISVEITSLPDSNVGILTVSDDSPVDENQVFPINTEFYYESFNTSVYPDSIASTSIGFRVASQIDSNYNLNWSTQSAITFTAYSPPVLTIAPLFVDSDSTTRVQITLDIIGGVDGSFTVTQLPSNGALFLTDDDTNAIDTSTVISQTQTQTELYYKQDSQASGSDSFSIMYQDDTTTSNEVNVDILIGINPAQIDSSSLSQSHTEPNGFDTSNNPSFELPLGQHDAFEIDSTSAWTVHTRVNVDAHDDTNGAFVHATTQLNSTIIDNLTGLASTVPLDYEIGDQAVFDTGVLSDSLTYTVVFVYTHTSSDNDYERASTPETFTLTMYQPPNLIGDSSRTLEINTCGRTRIFNDSTEDDTSDIRSYNLTDLPEPDTNGDGFVLWKNETDKYANYESIDLSQDEVYFEIVGYPPVADALKYDLYPNEDSVYPSISITLNGTRTVPQGGFTFEHTVTYNTNSLPTLDQRTVTTSYL